MDRAGETLRKHRRHHQCSHRTTSRTGKFGEGDSDRLQAFADVCADVNSQLDFLPGLGYLNYPTAIVPIVQNLPSSIRSKWEKRVVHHAEKYDDAYPGFKDFAAMIQEQARLKNHPNVLASTQLSSLKQKTRDPRPRPPDAHEPSMDSDRRVLKSTMEDRNIPKKGTGEEKYCPFHQRKGHILSECKAFESETLEAKNECILKSRTLLPLSVARTQVERLYRSREMC